MAENDELFTLQQHFFTGEYAQVAAVDMGDYTGSALTEAIQYKLRALVILGQFSEAESLISSSDEDESFKQALKAYVTLAQGGDASSPFESLISEKKDASYVQILGSFYLVKNGRLEEAFNLLQRHENSLEAVLLSVQLLLAQGKLDAAEKQVTLASSYAQDSIVYNLAEAYLNSAKNGDNLRGSLYFFEELSHGHPTYQTLLGQLVLNLQLHEFEDAEEIFKKLDELDGVNADVIANEFAFANIEGDSSKADEKLKQLESLAPEHPVIVDYKEKNVLFDSIVEKYKDQIVN